MKKTKTDKLAGLSDKTTTWLFLVPTCLIVSIAVFAPLIYSFYLSFHRYRLNVPNAEPVFIGLKNYIDVFQDDRFFTTSGNTIVFALSTVILSFILGLALAMMLSGDSMVQRIIVSLLLVPMIMAPVAAGNLWRMMLDRTSGVINYLMTLVGLTPIAFLGSAKYAMASVVFVEIWKVTPWVTILLISALKGLPNSTVEAAVVDGAGRFYIFKRVILPQLLPVIIVVFMIRFIDSFKVFDLIYVMTAGGPGTATEMLPNFIYNQGLKNLNIGYSAALAFIFILTMALMAYFFIRLRNKANEMK